MPMSRYEIELAVKNRQSDFLKTTKEVYDNYLGCSLDFR